MIDEPTQQPQHTPSASDGAFLALGLDPALVAAVAALGYEEPTDIQREAIPPLTQVFTALISVSVSWPANEPSFSARSR